MVRNRCTDNSSEIAQQATHVTCLRVFRTIVEIGEASVNFRTQFEQYFKISAAFHFGALRVRNCLAMQQPLYTVRFGLYAVYHAARLNSSPAKVNAVS